MSAFIGGRAWVPLYRAGAGRGETPAEDDLELRLRGPRRLHNPHRGGREAEQGALEPALLLLLLQLHHEEQLQASQGMKSQRPGKSKSAFLALYYIPELCALKYYLLLHGKDKFQLTLSELANNTFKRIQRIQYLYLSQVISKPFLRDFNQ